VNGKMYVGSSGDIEKRMSDHRVALNRGSHHSVTLQRAWEKYGADAFEFSVVAVVEHPEQLLAEEQRWIDHYRCVGRRGYNVSPTAGSPRGVKHSAEARDRMRAAKIGRKLTPEHRAKIGASGAGKKMDQEAVARRNAARRANGGFTQSAESYAKMVQTRRARGGFQHTDETRKTISEKMRLVRASSPA
jgi:group I intron endonuclease